MAQQTRTQLVQLASAGLLLIVFNVGCGSGGPFKYLRVSGKVSYDDGTPIPGGCRLMFSSLDVAPVGKAYPRPGIANVDANGNFDSVTSYKYGDGLVPGKHKVSIQAANERDGKLVVPKEYASTETTPLVLDTADAPFDIQVPKPKPK